MRFSLEDNMPVDGVSTSTPIGNVRGTIAAGKAITEATLQALEKQKAETDAPLKIPDARHTYGLGQAITIKA